jgi:SAM-dependent methyltransferase
VPARITVSIPAYESKHLEQCLASLAVQGVDDMECFVVDDGSSAASLERIRRACAPYSFVTLLQNPERLGARGNFMHCLTLGSGEYVKVLQHDDLLEPGALAEMIEHLDEHPEAVLATSSMKLIDGAGNRRPDEWWNSPICPSDVVMSGRDLVAITVQTEGNPMGSPCAAVIRRSAIDQGTLEFMLNGVDRAFDVAAWVAIASFGDVIYFSAPRCSFRIHDESLSGQSDLGYYLTADWGTILERAILLGAVTPAEATIAWETYLPRVRQVADSAQVINHPMSDALHDRHALAMDALGGGRLTGIVLSDGISETALHTAYAARTMLDTVVVLERTPEGIAPSTDEVKVVPCDWFDEQALGEAIAAYGTGPVVLLAAGEELVAPSALRARAEFFTLDFHAERALVTTASGPDERILRLHGEDVAEVPLSSFAIRSLYERAPEQVANVGCPVCGAEAVQFTPLAEMYRHEPASAGFAHPIDAWELLNLDQYECLHCSATDRDRAMWMYARNELGGDVLDIAPARALSQAVRSHPAVRSYRSADAEMTGVDDVIDIQALPYPDHSFDWVFCSHVLEHVPDDVQALRELQRVLKPNGRAVVLAPVSLHLDATIEDPTCIDPAERLRRFGQDDHIRVYTGDELERRIGMAGLRCDVVSVSDWGIDACTRSAVPVTGRLYIGHRGDA